MRTYSCSKRTGDTGCGGVLLFSAGISNGAREVEGLIVSLTQVYAWVGLLARRLTKCGIREGRRIWAVDEFLGSVQGNTTVLER